MKKLMLLAIPAILASCGPEQYTINGKAGEDLEGKKVVLMDGEKAVDSCTITKGVFSFTGMVKDQTMYVMNVEQNMQLPVFLQNGAKIEINLNEAPANVKDQGGMNDKYAEIMEKVGEAGKSLNEKFQRLASQGVDYPAINDSLADDLDMLKGIYRDGIVANKDNYVGAVIMSMAASDFYQNLASLDSAIAEVKYANKVEAIKLLRSVYESLESTKEGKMFVDFTAHDTEGKTAKLSDYVGKGKYVLVDFWASWCGPCKREIPNLVELHKNFAGEKFTVLGVNVWDEESKFKEALESEGINYPQIFVPRDNKDNATEIYGIQGIPQIILFAPDGTIVKRDLRGEEMKKFVADKLK